MAGARRVRVVRKRDIVCMAQWFGSEMIKRSFVIGEKSYCRAFIAETGSHDACCGSFVIQGRRIKVTSWSRAYSSFAF